MNLIVYEEEGDNLYYVTRTLKDKYKVVIELYYINHLKTSEIAKTLHISEANVRTRLKRARDELKKHINEEDI